MTTRAPLFVCFLALALVACGPDPVPADSGVDAGPIETDAGLDSSVRDAGPDSDVPDDSGPGDAGPDAQTPDAGPACADDTECDNSMACDGVETCVDGACVAGTPVDEDGDGDSACTDCDDTDPDRHAGATETCDGIDEDCDVLVDEDASRIYFTDCDGDGLAPDDASTLEACAPPAPEETGCGTDDEAWTETDPSTGTDFDCADDDSRAHTGATEFQTDALPGVIPEWDYDYDCDRVETQEFATAGSCTLSGATCNVTMGWFLTPGASAPACGESGLFIASCGPGCAPTPTTRTQACR